jgi:hypothetical protein
MRIRQIVFAARDLKAGSATLASLLQLDPPFRDPGVGEFGLDNAVFVFGDQFIEIVSPVRDDTTAGRLLERRGDSGYMLILQTDDFAGARARLAQQRVRTVFEAEYPDIRAVHLHPKDIGGAIVSLDQPQPAAAWRWGGPDWRMQPGKRAAQRVLGVMIEAHDPGAMANRWREVLDLEDPFAVGARWRLPLHSGYIEFLPARARGEGIYGYALAVAEHAAVLDAARAAGLPIDGDVVTLFGARVELQAA